MDDSFEPELLAGDVARDGLAAELGLLATLTLAINAHSNENIAVRTADFRK
jgi:hypothetical protein